MTYEEFKLLEEEVRREEAAESGVLPDLAERRETLKRANEALERARTLLEQVNRLEPGNPIRAEDAGTPTESR